MGHGRRWASPSPAHCRRCWCLQAATSPCVLGSRTTIRRSMSRRWNGTAFEALGPQFQAQNQSIVSPVMVADASGNPIRPARWAQQLRRRGRRVERQRLADAQPRGRRPGRPRGNVFRNGASFVADDHSRWPADRRLAGDAKPRGRRGVRLRDDLDDAREGAEHGHSELFVNGPVVRVNSAGDIFLAWIDLQPVPGNNTEQVSVAFRRNDLAGSGRPAAFRLSSTRLRHDHRQLGCARSSAIRSCSRRTGGISCSPIAGTGRRGSRPRQGWPRPAPAADLRLHPDDRNRRRRSLLRSRLGCISTTRRRPPRSPLPATSPDCQILA